MKRRLLFSLVLVLAACKKDPPPPSRWDPDPAKTDAAVAAAPVAATVAEAKPGSAFNAFFPADGAQGTKRVFTQEKLGYAEAKMQKDGKDVVVLSISDTLNDPEAKSKFANAPDRLYGSPLVTVGKNQSAVLVKDRYQVKASSQSLDAAARKTWLSQFNLSGIAGL